MEYWQNCAECAVVAESGRRQVPQVSPIPVQHLFQILRVVIMELPSSAQGNQYAVVFPDFFTKWCFMFPVPGQNTIQIARMLTE